MPDPDPAPLTLPSSTSRCPFCGGRLGEPVSGDLHCYVQCTGCAARFQLDDPELTTRVTSEP